VREKKKRIPPSTEKLSLLSSKHARAKRQGRSRLCRRRRRLVVVVVLVV